MTFDFDETFPPGVAVQDEFLHRAGEVLVSVEAADAVADILEDATYSEDEEDVAQGLGVRRYSIQNGRAPIEMVRAAEREWPGAVGLNHVLLTQPRLWSHTAGPAQPADASPEITGEGAGRGFAVAVLDTGYSDQAPALARFGVDDVEVLDEDGGGALDAGAGHGTFVAGVIRGLLPGGEVHSLRVLDSHGVGDDFGIAAGLRRMANCQIVNLSLGGPTLNGTGLPVLGAAIDALDPEIVVVAAAGNAGGAAPFFPGAFKRVVCVGATENERRAPWSNYGWWVDACAEGVNVHSVFPAFQETAGAGRDFGSGGARWFGTSFAAPKVAAAIALVAERDGRTPREAARYLLHEAGLPVLATEGLGTLIDPGNLP